MFDVRSNLWFVSLAAVLGACGFQNSIGGGGDSAGRSDLATIGVTVPSATAATFGPNAKLALMTHIHFLVLPVDPNCKDASTVDALSAYATSKVEAKVFNGCDYLMTMSMGEQAQPGNVVAPQSAVTLGASQVTVDHQQKASQKIRSLYTNFLAKKITSTELKAAPGGVLDVELFLNLTKLGVENGYTTQVKTKSPVPTGTGTEIGFTKLADELIELNMIAGTNTIEGAAEGDWVLKSPADWAKISKKALPAGTFTGKFVVGRALNASSDGVTYYVEQVLDDGTDVIVKGVLRKTAVSAAVISPVYGFVTIPKQTKAIKFQTRKENL